MRAKKNPRDRYKWRKVVAPGTWRPVLNEELFGYYGGRTSRSGSNGPYEVTIIHLEGGRSVTISGTVLLTLFDAAQIEIGHPVLIAYRGLVRSANAHDYKKFDLFVADGVPLPPDWLPKYSAEEGVAAHSRY